MKSDRFDKSVAEEVLAVGQYDRFVQIEPGDFVVDLGCSKGYLYYRNQEVKGIEYLGVDAEIDSLATFIAALEPSDNVRVLNAMVMPERKVESFTGFFGGKLRLAMGMTFRDLLCFVGRPIDFLKFDIESWETCLFGDNYLLLKDNVRKFAGEFHFNGGFKSAVMACLDQLRADPDVTYRLYATDGVDITECYWSHRDFYTEVIVNGYFSKQEPRNEPASDPFINFYRKATKRIGEVVREKCDIHFVDGPFAEIRGARGGHYTVRFIDQSSGQCLHKTELARNHWARANRKYFTDWRVLIADERGRTSIDYRLSLNGAHVYIALDSKALGDSVAWMPFVEQFRVKHNCRVTCSTFWNGLFEGAYPEINFVLPGTGVERIMAMYKVGCFNVADRNLSPAPWNSVPLQAVAAGILGLPAAEIKPKIVIESGSRPASLQGKNYVCIATESTAQCKFWNRPGAWEELAAKLKAKGWEVVNLGLNAKHVPGTIQWPKGSIHRVIDCLLHAEFFIGLPSGLSWLAWALSKTVVTISGFSLPSTEFQSNRIHVGPPSGVCQGCYNTHVFDPGEWNWCPKKPATPFECTREITADAVLAAINAALPYGQDQRVPV